MLELDTAWDKLNQMTTNLAEGMGLMGNSTVSLVPSLIALLDPRT